MMTIFHFDDELKMTRQSVFEFDDDDTIQGQFEQFDRDHPEVFREFRSIAQDLVSRGITRYSADAICHVIRYHRIVNQNRDGGFKISNNHTSRYARKLIEDDPSFAGFFQIKTLKRK